MKVIVAKMPGGKAISVTLEEGATIKDAIAAAGLEGSTDGGFEIRKNDEPAQTTDTVAHQDIIALTKKIEGNAKNTVTLQFVHGDGTTAEQIEVLKDFPLNPAKLFVDIDNDNERLTVEGYILSNSNKNEYNPADYHFAVVKEGKSLAWKPLINRNWIAGGCLILIADKNNIPENIINEKDETPEKVTSKSKKKKLKSSVKPKVEESVAKTKLEEPITEKPKKRSKKAKAVTVTEEIAEPKVSVTENEAPCECTETCCNNSETPCKCHDEACDEQNISVKLNPSPELLSELTSNGDDEATSVLKEIMADHIAFVQHLKAKYCGGETEVHVSGQIHVSLFSKNKSLDAHPINMSISL